MMLPRRCQCNQATNATPEAIYVVQCPTMCQALESTKYTQHVYRKLGFIDLNLIENIVYKKFDLNFENLS